MLRSNFSSWTGTAPRHDTVNALSTFIGISACSYVIFLREGGFPSGGFFVEVSPTCNPPSPKSGPEFPDSPRFVSPIQWVAGLETRKRHFMCGNSSADR